MWKVLFAFLAVAISHVWTSPCCEKGVKLSEKVFKNEATCDVSDRNSGLTRKDKRNSLCKYMFKLCCKRAVVSKSCSMGKIFATSGLLCYAGETQEARDCCSACKRGIATGKNGGNCDSQQLTTRLKTSAFTDCCSSRKGDNDKKKPPKSPTADEPTKATGTTTTTAAATTTTTKSKKVNDKKKKTCADVKCDTDTSAATGVCRETERGPHCECKTGYKEVWHGDTNTCEDVDECTDLNGKLNLCNKKTTFCMNFKGYYRCPWTCPSPAYHETKYRVCEDVDECKKGKDNCHKETHKCVNTIGSFYCKRVRCKKGFNFVRGQCEEIDQCKQSPCPAGDFCFSYGSGKGCIKQSCPHPQYYNKFRGQIGNRIDYCQKDNCDRVSNFTERARCWDGEIYPSSIKRYAYKFQKEAKYEQFNFEYSWRRSDYRVKFTLLEDYGKGTGDYRTVSPDFYMQYLSSLKVKIFNQKTLRGPRNYVLNLRVDIRRNTYEQQLVWRYDTLFYIYVSS